MQGCLKHLHCSTPYCIRIIEWNVFNSQQFCFQAGDPHAGQYSSKTIKARCSMKCIQNPAKAHFYCIFQIVLDCFSCIFKQEYTARLNASLYLLYAWKLQFFSYSRRVLHNLRVPITVTASSILSVLAGIECNSRTSHRFYLYYASRCSEYFSLQPFWNVHKAIE